MDLFTENAPDLPDLGGSVCGARLSEDRRYRYSLWRRWEPGCPPERMAMFVGLNPSTADETEDDPTIRRCIGFAKSWGCGGLVMTNLFAFRATDPKDMRTAIDPEGAENQNVLYRLSNVCSPVVCCWGTHGEYREQGRWAKGYLQEWGRKLHHLGLTKDGHPKHPLYLKADTPLTIWE
jgi:hypothetical protein